MAPTPKLSNADVEEVLREQLDNLLYHKSHEHVEVFAYGCTECRRFVEVAKHLMVPWTSSWRDMPKHIKLKGEDSGE
jgi:hypothetical protein